MNRKTENNFKLKLPVEIELTEEEHRQLISISDGDVRKMVMGYLKELAAGKKKIKSFKERCPFCDRTITIYTDGRRIFLNSTRPDLA